MSMNNIVLMGRLTKDPELRSTSNGNSVCSFTLAVDRNFAADGKERESDFIPVVAWRGTADFVSKYFQKGSMMAVQGALQTRKYEDKDGNKRTAFEVIASQISFCGGKNDAGSGSTEKAKTKAAKAEVEDDEDDDLPF